MAVLPPNEERDDRPPDVPAANPIAFSDVASLGVAPHWAEAVAAVEELCAVLVARDPAGTWVPDPRDVVITAQGSVEIRRGAEGSHDIDDVGRMLHGLLDPASTPMPIRLFIAQSIGSGKFASVQSYAEALAYYGRPGRTELIQALYQRCLEAPPVPPPAAPVPDEPIADPVQRVRRPWWTPAAVVLCGALALLAVWMWQARSGVHGSVTNFTAAVAAAASATAERIGWRVAPPSTPERVERDDRKPGSRERRATTRRQGPSGTPRVAGTSITPPPLVGPPAVEQPQAAPGFEGGLARAPGGAPATPATPVFIDPTIYSSKSPGVDPPVMSFPQLPPVAPAPAGSADTNTMELLIDEKGDVREARLTSPPRRLPDMMLLSGAKTWKFRPALKDGRPVKYRLELSWVVTPP